MPPPLRCRVAQSHPRSRQQQRGAHSDRCCDSAPSSSSSRWSHCFGTRQRRTVVRVPSDPSPQLVSRRAQVCPAQQQSTPPHADTATVASPPAQPQPQQFAYRTPGLVARAVQPGLYAADVCAAQHTETRAPAAITGLLSEQRPAGVGAGTVSPAMAAAVTPTVAADAAAVETDSVAAAAADEPLRRRLFADAAAASAKDMHGTSLPVTFVVCEFSSSVAHCLLCYDSCSAARQCAVH